MRPWMTVEGVYVAAPSKHKDAAYDFVEVPDRRRRRPRCMALEGRQTPANKAVYDDPQVAADPVLEAFRKQVEVGRADAQPRRDDHGLVAGDHGDEHRSCKKSATPKEALDEAQKEVVEARRSC